MPQTLIAMALSLERWAKELRYLASKPPTLSSGDEAMASPWRETDGRGPDEAQESSRYAGEALAPCPPATWKDWTEQRLHELETRHRAFLIRLAALEAGPQSPPSGSPTTAEAPLGEIASITTEGGWRVGWAWTPTGITFTIHPTRASLPLVLALGDAEPD